MYSRLKLLSIFALIGSGVCFSEDHAAPVVATPRAVSENQHLLNIGLQARTVLGPELVNRLTVHQVFRNLGAPTEVTPTFLTWKSDHCVVRVAQGASNYQALRREFPSGVHTATSVEQSRPTAIPYPTSGREVSFQRLVITFGNPESPQSPAPITITCEKDYGHTRPFSLGDLKHNFTDFYGRPDAKLRFELLDE